MGADVGGRRRHVVVMRLGDDELAELDRRVAASGWRWRGEYARAALLGAAPARATVPAANAAEYAKLARLGGNLNQLAHHLNAGNIVARDDEQARLQALLTDTREELRRLRLALLGREG